MGKEQQELDQLKKRVDVLEAHVDHLRLNEVDKFVNAFKPKAAPPTPILGTSVPPPGPHKRKKLVLHSHCSPGDIIMLTAAVRDLHKNHPGEFLTDVHTTAMQIWDNNPYVTKFGGWHEEVKKIDGEDHAIPVAEVDSDVRVLLCNYPLIDESWGKWTGSNHSPHHFIHGYIRNFEDQLNLRIKPTLFKGDIHLSDAEKKWISQAEEKGVKKFWIVMAGGKNDFTAKWWDPTRYQAVVDHFKGKINFIQAGEMSKGHWHEPLKNVLDLRGKTDTRQFIRLMYHAEGVVCPVTFAMHLAAAVETKPGMPKNRACVVIAGGREPSQWEAYPHHQYIHTNGALFCCDDGGCWRSRCQLIGDGDVKDRENVCTEPIQITPQLRIPNCLDLITADEVIRRIELYHKGGALKYL